MRQCEIKDIKLQLQLHLQLQLNHQAGNSATEETEYTCYHESTDLSLIGCDSGIGRWKVE